MSLVINHLSASNFRCFRDIYIQLPTNGIYYLQGVNEDASYTEYNGVGKSTLMDLIPMILFGRGIRDSDRKKLTYKDYLKYGTKTANLGLKVTDSEGREYTILRELTAKGSTLMIKLGEDTLQGQFAVDYLKDKLGLTFQAFVTSSLFGQGKFQTFLFAGEEEKVGLLEELFKLKQIEDIRKELKDKYDELADQFNSASKELSIAESEYKVAEAKYLTLKEMYSNDREKASKFLRENDFTGVNSRLDTLVVAFKRKNNHLTDIDSRIIAIDTVLNSSSWGVPRGHLEVGKPCPLCKRVVEVGLDEQDWIERQNKKQTEYNTLKEQLAELKNERSRAVDEIQTLDKQILELNHEKKTLEEGIERSNSLLSLSDSLLETSRKAHIETDDILQKAREFLGGIQGQRDKIQRLREILGDKELRAIIVSNYLDLINHYSQKYVQYLTNGELSIEFSFKANKIEVEIIDSKNNYRLNFFQYSGGEKRRLDFGVFLAFNQVNRHVLKSPLQILLLDETFDQVDQMGIEKCIDLIKQEQDDLGLILVTGHSENLSDLFQDKINLVKKGGVTVLQ